jgi:hypothetical protein
MSPRRRRRKTIGPIRTPRNREEMLARLAAEGLHMHRHRVGPTYRWLQTSVRTAVCGDPERCINETIAIRRST